MWLELELTMAQKLELEQMKRIIGQLTREELEAVALDAVKQSYSFRNAFKSVAKEKL